MKVFCSYDIFLARFGPGLGHMVHEEEDGYERR